MCFTPTGLSKRFAGWSCTCSRTRGSSWTGAQHELASNAAKPSCCPGWATLDLLCPDQSQRSSHSTFISLHLPRPGACRSTRDALFSAVRALELLLLQELAAANRRRLLDFCRRLQAAVGNEALHSPLGCALLGGTEQQPAAVEAGAPLDYNEALALASACWLAADGSRSAALQVGGWAIIP